MESITTFFTHVPKLSQVHSSGLIEDHSVGALEVDFANKYIGGGALRRGCVQVYFVDIVEIIMIYFLKPV